MILINSHFSKNKGTTDFFIDFLSKKGESFYVLKHPFDVSDKKEIELYFFVGEDYSLVSSYKKSDSFLFNLFKDLIISLWVSIKLRSKVTIIFGFGSFNIFPFILTDIFFKRKKIFWGVDYSRKRFSNAFLNKTYLLLETVSCLYADFVISVTQRQETARIKYHKLHKNKSIICTNGIIPNELVFNKKNDGEYKMIYIGSITEQHGVIDLMLNFFMKNNLKYPVDIIGSGNGVDKLKQIITSGEIGSNTKYLGFMSQKDIYEYIKSSEYKLIGIAPYSDKFDDHVYYGDSLKIKEYLNYYIPFLVSDLVYIPTELLGYGIVYHTYDDLTEKLKNLDSLFPKIEEVKNTLQDYSWNTLFSDTLQKINL